MSKSMNARLERLEARAGISPASKAAIAAGERLRQHYCHPRPKPAYATREADEAIVMEHLRSMSANPTSADYQIFVIGQRIEDIIRRIGTKK